MTGRLMDSIHLVQHSTIDSDTVALLVETPSAPHSSHAPMDIRKKGKEIVLRRGLKLRFVGLTRDQ